MTCVINDNIEGTTQTIYRTIGKDNSRYLTFHNGGNFNIGCNVNTTIVYTSQAINEDQILTILSIRIVASRFKFFPGGTCPKCQYADILYWVAEEQLEDKTWITEVVPPKQFRRSDYPLTMKKAAKFEETVEGFVIPPSHPEQYRGVWKGVQGDQNSCYMDASIFAMFSYLTVFDDILFPPKHQGRDSGDALALRSEIQHVMKHCIVNRLRRLVLYEPN